MNAWFLAIVLWYVLGLGIILAKHGTERKNEKYNFWSALFITGIMIFLIYKAMAVGI